MPGNFFSIFEMSSSATAPYAMGALAAVALPLLLLATWYKITPHIPLLLLLAVPVLGAFAAIMQPNLVPLVIFGDVVVLGLATLDLFTISRKKKYEIEREMAHVASLKKKHKITLHITNRSRFASTAWIRDDYPDNSDPTPPEFILKLGGRQRTSVEYEITPLKRGTVDLNKVYVRVRSMFGLWRRTLEYDVKSTLNIYPDMKQLSEYAILAKTNRLSLMGVRRTRKVGTENDFERLRDYTEDDNYRFIDWRASAKRNRLTVKDFQQSQSQRIIFLLDCGRLMTNEAAGISLLDHALNASLMLSYVALRQGDSVGMVCFSDRVLSYVPSKGGMGHMNQLLHSSFNQFPQLVESRYDMAFRHLAANCKKRSLIVFITNVIDEVNSHQMESYLGSLVGKHLPLAILLRDRRLFEIADDESRAQTAPYEVAAAAEILSWRHSVIRDMEHRGVLSLDVFPEDMTAPLVNAYLNIKARHLL